MRPSRLLPEWIFLFSTGYLRRPVAFAVLFKEEMSAIYQRVLGSDFDRLHPQSSADSAFRVATVSLRSGAGSWTRSGKNGSICCPSFIWAVGGKSCFPETRRNIPFTIENYA